MARISLAVIPLLVLIAGVAPAIVIAADAASQKAPQDRIALVIGNGAYRRSPSLAPLKNPVNDARAMGIALKDLGFDVMQLEDADRQTMRDVIQEFWIKAQRYPIRVFYYAGHAVSLDRVNYLIPVDADRRWEQDISGQGYDVDELVESLGRLRSGVSIVVLDTCRTNKLYSRRLPQWVRREPPLGTLVALSTANGGVAFDGRGAAHGIYTKYLLDNLRRQPELQVEQLFKHVGAAVSNETQQVQKPWMKSNLLGDFCFKAAANGECLYSAGDAIAK
ncbi:MAG: caspase family protein [Gammaproteobacteria bacterium]|nr:caspase family protein [Gammaproteobacteria bacterium]